MGLCTDVRNKLFSLLLLFGIFYCLTSVLLSITGSGFIGSISYALKTNPDLVNNPNPNINSLTLSNITKIVQEKIRSLQFPPDCRRVKKLICHVPKYGFCSQMHLKGYCLMIAYSTGRTLLPSETEFNYSPKLGWHYYFTQRTNCTMDDIQNRDYRLMNKNDANVEVLEIDSDKQFPLPSLPPAFPSNFAQTLLKHHSYPPLFWAGQFQTYFFRYQPVLQNYIDKMIDLLNFHEPTVGVHVRRTDKLQVEASYFEIDEYMIHVKAWLNNKTQLSGKAKNPSIFLLTDEPDVINYTVRKFPEYEFVYEYPPRRNWADPYTDKTLLNIILGVHVLARCSYVVCTFSSHVCRLAYELAQVIHQPHDWSNRFVSLDALYLFHNQQSRLQIVLEDHNAVTVGHKKQDLEMLKGDVLEVDLQEFMPKKQKFDGYLEGKNLRTRKRGRYPMRKVCEKWRIVDF